MVKFFGDKSESSNAVRDLLHPIRATRGKVPRWVLTEVRQAIKNGILPKPDTRMLTAGEALEHARNSIDRNAPDWTDHFGVVKADGVEVLVTEPYAGQLNASMLSAVEEFARIVGMEYRVSPNSDHYPGETFRIAVGPAEAARQVAYSSLPAYAAS